MLVRLLEALVFLLVLSAAWKVLATFLAVNARPTSASSSADRAAVKLIRDPVCGTYVSPNTAISDGRHYFCSEECRSQYKLHAPGTT